jgi:hypothetical protein
VRRLSATDGRAHQVLGLGLLLACPVVTFVWAVAHPARGPEAFVATIVAQLVACAYLGWLASAWARPTRRPGAVDLALAWLPLLLGAVSTWFTLLLATSYGIRGSAVPRVQQGIPFPADVGYLGALAAIALTFLVALVVLVRLVVARARLTP